MSKWNDLFADGGTHTNPTPDLEKLIPYLKSQGIVKILDEGCGNGRDTIYLAQQGFVVSAVDTSQTAIDVAKRNSVDLDIDYRVCDLTNLPYQDETFDFVLAGHSLEYTGEDIAKCVSELGRVLKPAKPIYVRILSSNHPFSHKFQDRLYGNSVVGYAIQRDIPIKFFTVEEVRDLFRQFKIEKLNHIVHEPSKSTGVPLNEWVLLGYKK
ncbi:MAG: class I SAM-dependent methyltransferase [Nanoarchaeota archaeon]